MGTPLDHHRHIHVFRWRWRGNGCLPRHSLGISLRDDRTGPSSGFVYARRQNRKGEEVGRHRAPRHLKSIANSEPPAEEVLVDRPTRTTASPAFPVPSWSRRPCRPRSRSMDRNRRRHYHRRTQRSHRAYDRGAAPLANHRAARQPQITLKSIRRPGRSLSLSAEAQVDLDAPAAYRAAGSRRSTPRTKAIPADCRSARRVAILFGPADGPVTAKAVLDAAKEANVKNYRHLYVIGFAITADARAKSTPARTCLGLPATFVAATMDLQMGDLLKTQRSSQIFSVCGAARCGRDRAAAAPDGDGTPRWQVKLRGLDVFDPVTMQPHHPQRHDVPCWMLDTAYNGMVFHADQVFFPKTARGTGLRRALKGTHDEAVWAHLAGDTSAPFAAALGPRSRSR